MDMNEYLSYLNSSYFQSGLLSTTKIGNDLKIKSTITGRIYPLSETGLARAFLHTARLGVNEAQTLTGSALDPFGYEHLAQTNVLNEFLERAPSNTRMQKALEDFGLSPLMGKRIQVERLGYSDIGKIERDGYRGLRVKLASLHAQQNGIAKIINPDFVTGGIEPQYIPLPNIDLGVAGHLGGIDEKESTWGFLTTRDNNAVALRFSFINEQNELTYLTQDQYTKLRVAMGGEAVSRSAMRKVGLTDPTNLLSDPERLMNYNPLEQLGALFQKLDKRISASTSSRDFSLVGEGVDSLVQEALSRLKSSSALGVGVNPGLYQRLEAITLADGGNALPRTLDDLFVNVDFTQSRLLESFKLDNGKSLFEDFTERAIAANPEKELNLIAGKRIIQGVGQENLNVSAESMKGILGVGGINESGFEYLGNELKKYYSSDKGGSKFKLDEFIEHLETLSKTQGPNIGGLSGAAGLSHNELARIAQKLKDGERVYDGSGVMAKFVVDHKLHTQRQEMQELKAIIEMHEINPDGVNAEIAAAYGAEYGIDDVKRKMSDLKSSIEKISASHDDLTARLGLSQGGVKAVLDIRDIKGVSDDLGVIGFGSKELFKKETNFGRANWSIFGETGFSGQYISLDSARHFPGEKVFTDIQASVFHSQVYSNPNLIAQVRQNMVEFESDVARMKNGTMPSSILRKIETQASLNPDDYEQLGFHSRAMASRYKQDAMEIQAQIRNGARPSELPDLLNKIITSSSKEVFRTSKTFKKGVDSKGAAKEVNIHAAVLPNAQRNAVDTEENLLPRQTFEFDRGRNLDTLLLNKNAHREIAIDLGNGEEILRMATYRHDDHKIVIGGSTLDELYEAKGGFDLDDKFLTDLHYITDAKGRKRLAAFSFRQPTGPSEFSILAPQMDNKTISRLFSGEDLMGENFRTSLMDFNRELNRKYDIDLIHTNKNAKDFSSQLTETLSKLTKEEAEEFRTVRYLNAISRNKMAIADIYRNGENGYIHDDVVEDMIIKIQQRSKTGINELSQDLIRKTKVDQMTGVRLPTATQLSEADFAYNPEMLPQWVNDRKIQIQNASLTIKQDERFVDSMRDIVDSNRATGAFDNDRLTGANFDTHAQKYLSEYGWSEDTTAHYLANLGVQSGHRKIEDSILVQVENLKMRLGEGATMQEGGNLGSYINSLVFTNSFERQMDDILKHKSMTPEDVDFFKSHFFAYNPESAIDAAIGGDAKIAMTQLFEQVVESQRYFEGTVGVNIETSTAKAFYQLYQLHDKDLENLFGAGGVIHEQYKDLAEFTKALMDPDKGAEILSKIQAQSEIISLNMIHQTGVEFGKMRSAFHSGKFGNSEDLRMAMDEIIFRKNATETKNFQAFLQGILVGHNDYKQKYTTTAEADEFASFIRDNLAASLKKPAKKTTYAQHHQKILHNLLEDHKFGLGYKGDVKTKYESTSLESQISDFTERLDKMKMTRTGDQTFTERLKAKSIAGRDRNVSGKLTEITEGTMLSNVPVEIAGEIQNTNLISRIGELNNQIRLVDQNLNFGSQYIDKKVEEIFKDNKLGEIIGSLSSPSDRLRYLQNRLSAEREMYTAHARSLIYDHLERRLKDTTNPVDARSLLEQYYIESQRLKSSKIPGHRPLGELMDNALTMGENFFNQVGQNGEVRLQLGEAYAAVKKDLTNKVSETVAKDEEIFHSLITNLEESAGENSAAAKSSVEARLRAILNPEKGSTSFSGETGNQVNDAYENILPELQDIEGKSLRDLINETMETADEKQAQKLEHFVQLMHSQDKETTENLIRKDLAEQSLPGVKGIGPFNGEVIREHQKYMDDLSLIATRFAARGDVTSQATTDFLELYKKDISNPIPAFNDIAMRYLSDEVKTGTGAIADLAGPKYTRIGDAIAEKFPNFLNYAKGNKTKLALGVGIAALGGAIYNKMRKRDHTAEGVAGPPLLPGGSAYERPATETLEYPSFSPASNGDLGVSYSVDVAGSQDQMQKFINASQSVSESGSNATIYSGIPNAGKDPYSEIASSY